MEKYSIQVVAKILGLSAQGLRHYEEMGILVPQRSQQNGKYRVYEHFDISALVQGRRYRQFGISGKDAAKLVGSADMTEIIDNIDERLIELDNEIKMRQLVLETMEEQAKLLREAAESNWKISFVTSPPLYLFPYMKNGKIILNGDQLERISSFSKSVPAIFLSTCTEWDALLKGERITTVGFGITQKSADTIGLDLQDAMFFPSQMSIRVITKLATQEESIMDFYKMLIDYVNEHKIKVVGDPIAREFLALNKNVNANEDYIRYREYWLPIRP